jgi:hypothetical protein
MKKLIANICVQVLRKLNVSVLIGYKIDGDTTSISNDSYMYDCELNGNYYLSNGDKFDVPNGKFSYSLQQKGNE